MQRNKSQILRAHKLKARNTQFIFGTLAAAPNVDWWYFLRYFLKNGFDAHLHLRVSQGVERNSSSTKEATSELVQLILRIQSEHQGCKTAISVAAIMDHR